MSNLFSGIFNTDAPAAAPDANTAATKLGLNATQITTILPLLRIINAENAENANKTVSAVIAELEPPKVGGKRRKSCKKGSKKGKKTKGRR